MSGGVERGGGAPGEPLRLAVLGLWHLGCVTAACCARHHRVAGLDFDEKAVAALRAGKAPLWEPGLEARLAAAMAAGRLRFTAEAEDACGDAEVLWVCDDTPVNERDEPDVAWVLERVRRAARHLPAGALVVVSSQLPAGTCRVIEGEFPQLRVACVPENLRLGKALGVFESPDRIVAGARDAGGRAALERLLAPISGKILFMRTESAEMVKHALNGFLALSVAYINEVARLCESAGADAREVADGLKTDARIGPRAYLGPGGAFAGGTLARDVVAMARLGADAGAGLLLIPAIKESNDRHRAWAWDRLAARLGGVNGRVVAVLGLAYKPGTDTVRRSAAVELCRRLLVAGAGVRVFDPAVGARAGELAGAVVAGSVAEAVRGADAAVVCTEWPEFREADWIGAVAGMRGGLVLDANGFLESVLRGMAGIEYIRVGCA